MHLDGLLACHHTRTGIGPVKGADRDPPIDGNQRPFFLPSTPHTASLCFPIGRKTHLKGIIRHSKLCRTSLTTTSTGVNLMPARRAPCPCTHRGHEKASQSVTCLLLPIRVSVYCATLEVAPR